MNGEGSLITSMAPGTAALDRVPQLLSDDPDRQFMARNLVMQAQADYAAAIARAEKSAGQVQTARTSAEFAKQRADAAEAQVRHLEAQLRTLQPAIRKGLIPPTMPSRGSYELKWPWLAASWAFLIAGIAMVVL